MEMNGMELNVFGYGFWDNFNIFMTEMPAMDGSIDWVGYHSAKRLLAVSCRFDELDGSVDFFKVDKRSAVIFAGGACLHRDWRKSYAMNISRGWSVGRVNQSLFPAGRSKRFKRDNGFPEDVDAFTSWFTDALDLSWVVVPTMAVGHENVYSF